MSLGFARSVLAACDLDVGRLGRSAGCSFKCLWGSFLDQSDHTILQGSYEFYIWFQNRNLQNVGFWLVKV